MTTLDVIRMRLEDLRTDVARLPTLPAADVKAEADNLMERIAALTTAIQERELEAWQAKHEVSR